MTYKTPALLLSLIAVSACTAPRMEEAKYWQRSNASSALYLQGPKAQQTLHKNISQCVSEIKELDRLGEVRRAVPANYNSGNEIEERTVARRRLDQWETPLYDGFLHNEHMDYHDFESCMNAKGWERVEFLPYSKADLARKEYLEQYGPKKKRRFGTRENVTTLEPAAQRPPPYKDVNN